MLIQADIGTPFSVQGRELAKLLRQKVPDDELKPVVESIAAEALEQGRDPAVASIDVFVTAVCHVGSKSLSHVLACVERTKERLLDMAAASEAARVQVVDSVMSYWSAHPGVALSIVEKLLNYAILTPHAVLDWALSQGQQGQPAGGDGSSTFGLAQAYIFEMVWSTINKVAGRVRQVVLAAADEDSRAGSAREVDAMRDLFRMLETRLEAWVTEDGNTSADMNLDDAENHSTNGIGGHAKAAARSATKTRWAQRWLRVFKRRAAVEEAFIRDVASRAAAKADVMDVETA